MSPTAKDVRLHITVNVGLATEMYHLIRGDLKGVITREEYIARRDELFRIYPRRPISQTQQAE